ncbi:hypothetical protein ACFLVN_05090 [Chloroflexota bacterium]
MVEIETGTQPTEHSKKWEADLQRQLAEYFCKKKYQVSPTKGYILQDRSDWPKNIILDKVSDYIKGKKDERHKNGQPFPLHKWIHHGLSSQALLFNLFGPLVVDKQWHIFDDILHQTGIQLSSVAGAEFEIEDRKVFNERQAQPTSIDLCIHTETDENVFIEFKFTEKNFGGCSIFGDGSRDGRNPAKNFNLCYLHNIERLYWIRMEELGLLTKQIKNDLQCPFSTLYQLHRLILFALEKNGHFLLLYDERNPSFLVERDNMKRGLFNLVYESLPGKIQDKCYALSVQSVVPILEKHPNLDWTNELKEKYFGEMV